MLNLPKNVLTFKQAKIANSKIEDHTDYQEDETRKLKIDLMLEEAGLGNRYIGSERKLL